MNTPPSNQPVPGVATVRTSAAAVDCSPVCNADGVRVPGAGWPARRWLVAFGVVQTRRPLSPFTRTALNA